MTVQGLDRLIAEHPLFQDFDAAYVALIAGCAKNVRFGAGEIIFSEGEPAGWFYLIRSGRASLDISVPGRGSLLIQTVEEGEVLGWSWLFPPYQWRFGARAVEPTRAVAIDGSCLRGKCDADPRLGYELMKRFAGVMMQRLQATRLQLLDIYGSARSS